MKRILVVDDDRALRERLRRYLSKHGFSVLTAEDAPGALALLEHEPGIGVVITDLMMPLMDGVQLAERIKTDPRFAELTVILITAFPEERLLEKGLRKGVALTLAKPVQLEQLLTLVGFAAS